MCFQPTVFVSGRFWGPALSSQILDFVLSGRLVLNLVCFLAPGGLESTALCIWWWVRCSSCSRVLVGAGVSVSLPAFTTEAEAMQLIGGWGKEAPAGDSVCGCIGGGVVLGPECRSGQVWVPSLCPASRSDCLGCGRIHCSLPSVSAEWGTGRHSLLALWLPKLFLQWQSEWVWGVNCTPLCWLVKKNLLMQTCARKVMWGVAMGPGEAVVCEGSVRYGVGCQGP